MKVLCTHCEAPAELDGLAVVDGGFGFTCSRCHRVNLLAPAAPPTTPEAPAETGQSAPEPEPEHEPPPPGTVECPKCQHWQPSGHPSCHRCGLMFAYAATGRARLPSDPLAAHPAAETIRLKWAALSRDLADTDGHHAFIKLCAEADLLEYAGQCYRRLADRGVDDPKVAEYRKRVLQAAMARMGRVERRSTNRDRQRTQRLIVMLVAAVIVFILAFGYYLLSTYQVARQFEG